MAVNFNISSEKRGPLKAKTHQINEIIIHLLENGSRCIYDTDMAFKYISLLQSAKAVSR